MTEKKWEMVCDISQDGHCQGWVITGGRYQGWFITGMVVGKTDKKHLIVFSLKNNEHNFQVFLPTH